MIALRIAETRAFMAELLMKETFDSFLIREASLTTFCTFTIDGTWHETYFGGGDTAPAESKKPSLTPWSVLRPRLFDLIKGQHTPLALKIVMQSSAESTGRLLSSISLDGLAASVYGLYLNIRFDGNGILLTTGSAQQSFPPNPDIDAMWDREVKRLLSGAGLAFEDIS